MRRATAPIEILLGFAVGMIAARCVQLPGVWLLHLLHVTARTGLSVQITPPLGVGAMWSCVFWGGVFGLVTAGWGVSYALDSRWFLSSVAMVILVRVFVDRVIAPIWASSAHLWAGCDAASILRPIAINTVWALTTARLLAAATLGLGTWGTWSPT